MPTYVTAILVSVGMVCATVLGVQALDTFREPSSPPDYCQEFMGNDYDLRWTPC